MQENMQESRIIIPLDGMSLKEALDLAKKLSGHVWGFKANDLLDKCKPEEIVRRLRPFGKVFLDPKFFDIPNTVGNRVEALAALGANMITVHCSGGKKMIAKALENAGDTLILGVTVLTSFDDDSCKGSYHTKVSTTFKRLANLGLEANLSGIVCSGHELKALYKLCDLHDCNEVAVRVVPGIRPLWYQVNDDQKRTMTPAQAIKAGASYLVIGRPIYRAQDPVAAADRTNEEIQQALVQIKSGRK